jgi:hypothetical protein
MRATDHPGVWMTQQFRPKFVAHSPLAPAVKAYPIRMSALGQTKKRPAAGQALLTILRHCVTRRRPGRHSTNCRPLRSVAEGFCCRLREASIEWAQGARTTLPTKKRDTFNQPKEAKMPAVHTRLGPFRLPWRFSPPHPPRRSPRRNTILAPPTTRSRSATSCLIADRRPHMA